jgi:mono/diheme cytochrome c family protein
MGRTKFGAIVLMLAFAACAKKEDAGQAAAGDTAAAATAPAPEAAAPAPANLPAGVTQEMVTQGQQIFTAAGNCFTCHGPDAKGTTLAPDLTDSQWLNVGGTYDEIVQLVKTGVPTPKQHPAPMPPMGGAALNDDQVKQVSAYVWSVGGGK